MNLWMPQWEARMFWDHPRWLSRFSNYLLPILTSILVNRISTLWRRPVEATRLFHHLQLHQNLTINPLARMWNRYFLSLAYLPVTTVDSGAAGVVCAWCCGSSAGILCIFLLAWQLTREGLDRDPRCCPISYLAICFFPCMSISGVRLFSHLERYRMTRVSWNSIKNSNLGKLKMDG